MRMRTISAIAFGVLGLTLFQLPAATSASAQYVRACGYHGCITRVGPPPRRVVVVRRAPRRVYGAPYRPVYVARPRRVVIVPSY